MKKFTDEQIKVFQEKSILQEPPFQVGVVTLLPRTEEKPVKLNVADVALYIEYLRRFRLIVDGKDIVDVHPTDTPGCIKLSVLDAGLLMFIDFTIETTVLVVKDKWKVSKLTGEFPEGDGSGYYRISFYLPKTGERDEEKVADLEVYPLDLMNPKRPVKISYAGTPMQEFEPDRLRDRLFTIERLNEVAYQWVRRATVTRMKEEPSDEAVSWALLKMVQITNRVGRTGTVTAGMSLDYPRVVAIMGDRYSKTAGDMYRDLELSVRGVEALLGYSRD